MKAQIIPTAEGYTILNPMNCRKFVFKTLLQAVIWCRENGFISCVSLREC
jgi:hypothetical protein